MDKPQPIQLPMSLNASFEEARDVLLSDSSSATAFVALGILLRERDSDSRIPRLLRDVLVRDDLDTWVRAFALQDLMTHGPVLPDLVEWCWRFAMKGDDYIVQKSGWDCLDRLAREGFIVWETIQCIAEYDSNRINRCFAIELLTRHWAREYRTVELLRRLAEFDHDLEIRNACLRELTGTQIADPAATNLINQRFTSSQDEASRAKLVVDLVSNAPGRQLWGVFSELIRSDPSHSVREAALDALINNWPNLPQTAQLLRELACRDDVGGPLGERVIDALVEHWRDDLQTLESLQHVVRHGREYDVAMNHLITIWPRDRSLWELLREVASSSDSKHRANSAVYALAKGWPGDDETRLVLQELVLHSHLDFLPENGLRLLVEHWSFDALSFLQSKISPDESVETRTRAYCLFESLSDSRVEAILHAAVESEVDGNARAAAVGVLVRKWWSPIVEDLLRRLIASDRDKWVRSCARRWFAWRVEGKEWSHC